LTLTWILVGFTSLLIALQLRALPRLIPQLFTNNKVTALIGFTFILFFSVLLSYWKLNALYACFFLATALAFSLIDPVFAFCLYFALLIFRPWELWPTDTFFLLMPRVGAIWVIGFAVNIYLKEKRRIIHSKSLILIAFFIWALISSLKSPLPGSAFSVNLQMLMPCLFLFLLVQFYVSDLSDYKLLVDSFGISVFVTAVLAIILYLGSSDDQGRIESLGILSNSNDIAALCVLALPFILKPFLNPITKTLNLSKTIAFCMSLPLLSVIYFSQSRGALLALAAIAGGWLFTHFKIRWYALVIFMAIIFTGVHFISGNRDKEDLQQSTDSRISYWIAGGAMALHNPILGVGMGRYPDEYEHYSSTHLYEFGNRTAHSSWILVLAETGIPGFLFYIALFLIALKIAYKKREKFPEVFLGLIGYMVAMSFLSHSYLFYPYFILGLAFSITKLNSTKLKSNERIS
jgi:putative inorganic carbon (HCO3(-)) transporter